MNFVEIFKIFLLAMTPIGELRAAIPIGLVVYKLDLVTVYIVSVLGNIFSTFLVLVLLGSFSKWSSEKFYFFNRFFAWLFSRTRKNHSLKVEKYGLYLLPLFVAIPLPITGAWTASLVAFVFGAPFRKSFPLISLGIMIAGFIVGFLTQTGITISNYFGWQTLIGIILSIGIIYLIYVKIKNNNYNN